MCTRDGLCGDQKQTGLCGASSSSLVAYMSSNTIFRLPAGSEGHPTPHWWLWAVMEWRTWAVETGTILGEPMLGKQRKTTDEGQCR